MMEDLEVEEQSLIADIVSHDQALTEEERKAERHGRRKTGYLAAVHRSLKLFSIDAPEYLQALHARNTYRRACALWPEQMEDVLASDFREDVRRRSGQCQGCGLDLPCGYQHTICEKCISEVSDD